MSTFGGDIQAKEILNNLTQGLDFSIPDINPSDPYFKIPESLLAEWQKTITKLNLEELTNRQVDGEGVFDVLMTSIKQHLREEYEKNRISGAEYSKTYTAIVEAVLSNAVAFLLQRDQSYWSAVQAQIGAITANVQLATARLQLAAAYSQAHTAKAEYALTTMKLATEDAQYALLDEQQEAVRGQTLDKRTDGTPITGSIGTQKDLYKQQITSYQRDAELKAGKLFADPWTVMRTLDEAYPIPDAFKNPNIDEILATIKENNNL